jgi:hypothetical protein
MVPACNCHGWVLSGHFLKLWRLKKTAKSALINIAKVARALTYVCSAIAASANVFCLKYNSGAVYSHGIIRWPCTYLAPTRGLSWAGLEQLDIAISG